MGIVDMIGGYKGVANADDSFDPLKGKYECVIDKVESKVSKDGSKEFFQLTLKVTKTISGDKGDGRLFWKSYNKDSADKMKELLNDLYTAEVEIDTNVQSDEEFASNLASAVQAKCFVNAYWFKGEKDMKGNIVPEDQRKVVQMAKIYKPSLKADKANADLPF